jgi:hypothetical protein
MRVTEMKIKFLWEADWEWWYWEVDGDDRPFCSTGVFQWLEEYLDIQTDTE